MVLIIPIPHDIYNCIEYILSCKRLSFQTSSQSVTSSYKKKYVFMKLAEVSCP